MKRDFKSWMLLFIFGLPVFLLAFIAFLYFGSCGFRTDCSDVGLPALIHTPIPTLISATLPAPNQAAAEGDGTARCTANAQILLSAWVSAGYQENEPFEFTDLFGANCQASYADLKPLFSEANLWYSGALACTSCHHAEVAIASAQLDLSSQAGMLVGSRRVSPEATGNDIFGAGNWEQSLLNDVLFISQEMPFGRPPGAVPEGGPVILAGSPIP